VLSVAGSLAATVPAASVAISIREAKRPACLELMDCARMGRSKQHSERRPGPRMQQVTLTVMAGTPATMTASTAMLAV
jgi:hypothetical protein